MKKIIIFMAVVVLLFSVRAEAGLKRGDFVLAAGGGVFLHPDTDVDVGMAGEYFLKDWFSMGMEFDIGFKNTTTFDLLGVGRYHYKIVPAKRTGRATNWDLYTGLGIGSRVDTNGNGQMGVMLPEVGVRYQIVRGLTLGPNASFHVLTDFNDATWDLRIHFLQLGFRF